MVEAVLGVRVDVGLEGGLGVLGRADDRAVCRVCMSWLMPVHMCHSLSGCFAHATSSPHAPHNSKAGDPHSRYLLLVELSCGAPHVADRLRGA